MPELPKIAPELSGLDHVPVSALEPFQGELKSLSKREYDKLKASLLTHGVIVPFFVWDDNGRYRLMDGHQRDRVFEREGWAMDVPVVWVAADNEQDAKRKLLVISSQYGRVTQEGWDEFTFDVPDAAEVAHFDALPFVFGGQGGQAEPINLDDFFEASHEDGEKLHSITFHYKENEAAAVVAAFATLGGTKEAALWRLLGLDRE